MMIVDQLGVVIKYLYDRKTARHAMQDMAVLRNLSVATFAAVSTASAVGLARMSVEVSKQVTNFQRLGESLGTTTQGYLELQHAFQIVGGDANDISDALQTISDYGLEAAAGNKEWIRTFTLAGVAIKDLKQAKPEDVLRVTADGIASLKTEAEQAAAASRLFGDDIGRKLLPLLEGGWKAFQDLKDEQRIFGGVVTEDQADAGARLTVSLRQLETIIPSLQRRIGLGLAPVLQTMADRTHAWARETMPLINGQVDRQLGILQRAIENIDTPLERLAVVAGAASLALGTFGLAKSIYTSAAAVSPAVREMGLLTAQYGRAAWGATKLFGALFLLYGIYDDVKVTAEGGDSVWSRLGKTMGAEGETQLAAKDLYEAFNNLVELGGTLATVAGTELVSAFDRLAEAMGFDMPEWMKTLSGVYKEGMGFLSDGGNLIGGMAGIGSRYLTGNLTDTDSDTMEAFWKRREALIAKNAAEQRAANRSSAVRHWWSPGSGMTDDEWRNAYADGTLWDVDQRAYLDSLIPTVNGDIFGYRQNFVNQNTPTYGSYKPYSSDELLSARSAIGSERWMRGAGVSKVEIGDININNIGPSQSYPSNEEMAAAAAAELERQILDALNQSAP